MKSILFVYGSGGGNTQLAVEAVAAGLAEKGHRTAIRLGEQCDPQELLAHDVVVLASPTYGQGILEISMGHFVERMKGLRLDGKPCAVIALGDPKYELQYHLEAAPLLEKAIADAGGKLLLPSLRLSRTPVMHLKGFIPAWIEQFAKALA